MSGRLSRVGSEHLYLSQLDIIELALGAVCRRHRLYGADAEDFASVARLHLIEDDYLVLRRFEGRSSLRTYLTIVITRCFQDWRNARWGKWRSSAEARRMGPLAEQLERMLVRDGLSFDESYESLTTNGRVKISRHLLREMAARFPVRPGRTFVSDEALGDLAEQGPGADARLAEAEAAAAAERVNGQLTEALARLPAGDRLIITMHFMDDFTLADVARALHLEQKPLYRRVAAILAGLAAALEARGVDRRLAVDLMARNGFLADVDKARVEKTPAEVRLDPRDGPKEARNGRPR